MDEWLDRDWGPARRTSPGSLEPPLLVLPERSVVTKQDQHSGVDDRVGMRLEAGA